MSISTETPLIPCVVADCVCEEAAGYIGPDFSPLARGYADRLAEHAEAVYANNANFAKRLRANDDGGRDALYSFMRHWLASFLKADREELFAKLPAGFSTGAGPAGRPGLRSRV